VVSEYKGVSCRSEWCLNITVSAVGLSGLNIKVSAVGLSGLYITVSAVGLSGLYIKVSAVGLSGLYITVSAVGLSGLNRRVVRVKGLYLELQSKHNTFRIVFHLCICRILIFIEH
jgi:hypothetical protein